MCISKRAPTQQQQQQKQQQQQQQQKMELKFSGPILTELLRTVYLHDIVHARLLIPISNHCPSVGTAKVCCL